MALTLPSEKDVVFVKNRVSPKSNTAAKPQPSWIEKVRATSLLKGIRVQALHFSDGE